MAAKFKNSDAGQICNQLTRIADALEALVLSVPEQTPPEQQTAGCQHPEELRVSLGMTNGLPDWECTLCQFRPPT